MLSSSTIGEIDLNKRHRNTKDYRIQIGVRNSTDGEDPKTGTGYRMHTILEKRNSGWVIQFSFHEF